MSIDTFPSPQRSKLSPQGLEFTHTPDLAEQLIEDLKYELEILARPDLSQPERDRHEQIVEQIIDALHEEGIDDIRIESLLHPSCPIDEYIRPSHPSNVIDIAVPAAA